MIPASSASVENKGDSGDRPAVKVPLKAARDVVCLSQMTTDSNSHNKMSSVYRRSIDETTVVNSDQVNNKNNNNVKWNRNKLLASEHKESNACSDRLQSNTKNPNSRQMDTDFVSQMYNENTVKKTKSCLRKLTGFFKSKGEGRALESIPSKELDSLLCLFFKEARKLDGEEFEPMSLGAFQCALDRYLRQRKYPCDILSDHTFALSREILTARKNELKIKQTRKDGARNIVGVNGNQQDCDIVPLCESLLGKKNGCAESVPGASVQKMVSPSDVSDKKQGVDGSKNTEIEPAIIPVQSTQNHERVSESSPQPQTRNVLTVRKTISCVRRMTAFFRDKGEERPVEQIPPNELDKLLCSFFREVKKLDGGQFEPMSLCAFQCALDRYLRDKDYPYNTLTDVDFALSRSVLNAKKKELKELSKGKKPSCPFELTPEEEDALWKEGLLGRLTCPSSLQRTVWYLNRKLLGLRCNQESYELKWGDLQLKTDPLKGEYLVYNDRFLKAPSLRSVFSGTPTPNPKSDGNNNHLYTIWPDPKRSDRCPIRFYKAFAKRRPHSSCLPNSPFYLSVKLKRMPGDEIFYKNCSLGIHSLEKMLKIINLPVNPSSDGTTNSVDNVNHHVCHDEYRLFPKSSNNKDHSHFVGGNGPTREHPDPLPVRPMNMLQSTAGYAEAGPSNQGYTGKPETSRRKKIATATVSSETVLIPDDSPPQPTAPKLQKKQIDDRRFDERRFEEQQRFQERRFENRRFDERRQQMAAAVQSAQVAAPSLQIPPQMQVKQHLQVAPPPPPPLQAPRQVQVLAPPPVQVPVPKPKPVEKPRPREKRIFVVADHQRCVMSNLASLWKSGKLCDAGIGNGSSTVMVHKVVLSAVCPKLLSVFSTDILSHKFLQVNFPEEVSTEALNAFAEYMYNGILDLDPDILQQLKIIAKRLDMKEFEQLCDSHLPNQHHQPVAAAATSSISFNNLPLIQTSVPIIPSIPTSHQTSLSSLNISTSSLPSVPSITTQVIDVKQEISEAELDQVKKDTAAVFGEESQVVSLAPNQSGNAGFVISPSIKTEPIGPEDDKYGRLGAAGKTNSSNNQVYTSSSSISAVPSSSISSLSTAAFVPPSSSSSLTSSSILSSIPTSSTEYAIPFTDTIDIKTTELKLTPTTASTTYVTPSLMPDLSSVTSIVEAVCSQPSAMNEDSTKPLTQQQPSLSAMSSSSSALEGPSLSSSGHDNIYPVGLFTAEGDNLPLLTTQTVGIKTIDLYKTDLT